MTTHTFRITVRGFFDALTQAQRSELLAEADQHDVVQTAYTPAGHLSYDLSAREAFAFRFLDTGQRAPAVTAEGSALAASRRTSIRPVVPMSARSGPVRRRPWESRTTFRGGSDTGSGS